MTRKQAGGRTPARTIYYRSAGWYGKARETQKAEDVPLSNLYMHVAAVAKCLAYPAGSETWKFKQLASVVPSAITSTTSDKLENDHLNYFAEYGGRNITMNGQVLAGECLYEDRVVGRITSERYDSLAAGYESEQSELRNKLTAELFRVFIRRIEVFEKPEKYSRTCGNTIVIHYTFECDRAFTAAELGKSS